MAGKTSHDLRPIRLVSVGIVARNEQASLGDILADLSVQDYPHDRIEIILVDSMSSDGTKDLMNGFARINDEDDLGFSRVAIFDNPKQYLPSGCNVLIDEFRGDVLIRVDAHARLPFNFVSQNVAVLSEGEWVCGGPRPTIASPSTPEAETLLIAEASAFGSSVADYRGSTNKTYVSSAFHAAFRREVIEKVGYYDERLLRTEDNDYFYRVRLAGYRVRFDARIQSHQIARSTFAKMIKQKYGNGYWVGRTLFIQPKCLHIYHFAPVIFVVGMAALLLIGACATWWPFLACSVAYLLVCIALTIKSIINAPKKYTRQLSLPIVFASIHVSYGIGTIAGVVTGLSELWKQ